MDLHRPCFSLEFVEESGDISLFNSLKTSVYSRSSLKSNLDNRLTSTGNSLLAIVRMRNPMAIDKLNSYLGHLFPIKAHVLGKTCFYTWILDLDNTEIIIGAQPKSIFAPNSLPSIGYIQSPASNAYPRNFVKNYTLINQNTNGFIRLVFDDFKIHFKSLLKVHLFYFLYCLFFWIFDSDETEIFNSKEDYRRPPAILSKSNKLTIVFESNNFIQEIGFRARYEFIDTEEWPDRTTDQSMTIDFLKEVS